MQELHLPREIVDQIITHCRACYPNEACGILAGDGNTITRTYLMTNVESSPVSYLMEPGEQFRVMKELRQEGLAMLAIFHSHPQSPAFPSPKDVSLAFYDDLYYVIVGMMEGTLPDIRTFRIFEGEVNEVITKVIR